MRLKSLFSIIGLILSFSLSAQTLDLTSGTVRAVTDDKNCRQYCAQKKLSKKDCDCHCAQYLGTSEAYCNPVQNLRLSGGIGEDLGEDCNSGVCIPVSLTRLSRGVRIKNPFKKTLYVYYSKYGGKKRQTIAIRPGQSKFLSGKEFEYDLKRKGSIDLRMKTSSLNKNSFSGNVRLVLKK